MSMPLNGGTLTWTATPSGGTCGFHGSGSYSQFSYSNFAYTYNYPSPYHSGESIPITTSLTSAQIIYIWNSPGQQQGCPPNGPQPAGGSPVLDSSQFYRILFTPTAGGYGTATMEQFEIGGVAPKYSIISVIYAPPNPGSSPFGPSFVDYTGTTALGTDTTLTSSFQQSSTYSTAVSLLGTTLSMGSGYTQSNDTTNSISVNQTSSVSNTYPGSYPASSVIGLDHDNDIILVWLNGALDCSSEDAWTVLPIPAAVQCIEYEPQMAPGDPDDPLMDIVELPVGWLNGDFPMNSDVQNILTSHGITAADYPTILAADPYAGCVANINCVQNQVGLSSTRWDLVVNPGIFHFETLGTSKNYTATYAQTSSQGQSATNSRYVSYSLGGTSSFKNIFSLTTNNQTTLTWTDKWSYAANSSIGKSAKITINEPTGNYSGPTQFAVYKDNIYGTFMSYPTQ